MRNYSGFYQGLSGYYIVFMNNIPGLTLSIKIILLQLLSACGVKTFENFSYENFSPSLTLPYAITKKPKKENICGTKAIEGIETHERPQ